MQEIPRALLLPPPSSAAARTARGANPSDRDLPVDGHAGVRRNATAADGRFLILVDARREDSVEFGAESSAESSAESWGKQFRFRPYGSRGATAEREAGSGGIERQLIERGDGTAASDDVERRAAAREVLDGLSSGDGRRNSAAFLASLIAQERLSEGLHNSQHAEASDAYRRAGGLPPRIGDQPRVLRFAA